LRSRGAFLPGLAVVAVGCAVFAGWLVDSETLKSVSPRFSEMKANTAVGFVFAGVSLLLLQAGRRRMGGTLALFVVLLGVATLAEYVFGVRLGIDELLFKDVSRGPGTPSPGRMGANTAFNFTLAGLSLLLLDVRWRRLRPTQAGAAIIALVALVALLGYAYGVPRLQTGYVTRNVVPMAVHTAIAFVVLAMGLVLARPQVGIIGLLRSPGAGGILLRRLALPGLFLPALLGYARLEGQRAGWFGTAEGVAWFAASLIVVFTGLVVVTARSLERVDVERRASEARERGIIDVALDCIVVIDERGRVLDFNPAAERTFGYPRDVAIGRELAELIIPPALRESHRAGLVQVTATGESKVIGQRLELTAMRADGSEFPVELTIAQLRRSGRQVFVGHVRDISERVAAHQTSSLLGAVVESSRDAIIVADLDSTITVWNDAAERIYGYSAEEMVGQSGAQLVAADQQDETRDLEERLPRGESVERETVRFRKDGEPVHVGQTIFPVRLESGEVVGVAAIVRDLTEHRRLEEQLRQAQKMEAIGQLAGGVAHDFNNLLTVIGGFAGIAKRRIGVGPGGNELTEIEHAAERAGLLTRQLLAFARSQVLDPVALDLNEVVTGLTPMLARLIGEDVEIGVVAGSPLPTVLADRGQLEQVIVNLAINGRDAMPAGGILTISTRSVELDERYVASHAGVVPGEHVCLTVADTGGGIDPELQERIFEPFFTTKEVGKGTGLGLATVHGIVNQSGGHIEVYSEPGLGTSFKLYFPGAGKAVALSQPVVGGPTAELEGTETILLCEDDDAIRRYIAIVLVEHGYTVVPCAEPGDAIDLVRGGEQTFDILLTDVVMPELSGPALAERLRELQPDLRVVFLSGYSKESLTRQALPPDSIFVEKPFEVETLLHSIRSLLATRR
jgi:PAS domain S-box-containing protein